MARAPEMSDACRPGGTCPDCNAKPPKCASPFCEERAEEGGEFCQDCREMGDEYLAEGVADDCATHGIACPDGPLFE